MKSKTHTLSGILFGEPNHNGHIYDRDMVAAAIDRAPVPLLVQMDVPEVHSVAHERACGKVESIEVGDREVTVRWSILDTPLGQVFSALDESGLSFSLVTVGTGRVDVDGKVSDFEILSLAAAPPRGM